MSQASQQTAQQSAAAQEALRMQEAVIRSQAEAAIRLAMTQGLSQLNQHQQDNSHSPLRHNGKFRLLLKIILFGKVYLLLFYHFIIVWFVNNLNFLICYIGSRQLVFLFFMFCLFLLEKHLQPFWQ